jgi:hypothetical protein
MMPRNLSSPRLSDDVVRALYREGLRRRQPMKVQEICRPNAA